MESALFGEGMTWIPGNKLVQITWKSQRGFIYDAESLDLIKEFKFSSTRKEGWGITWDACKNELIETDGSEFLHFWDPETMREKRKIAVNRLNGKPAKEMNEIEFWRGRVLANIWYEDVLLVINPETGIVEKEYGEFGMATDVPLVCCWNPADRLPFLVCWFRILRPLAQKRAKRTGSRRF